MINARWMNKTPKCTTYVFKEEKTVTSNKYSHPSVLVLIRQSYFCVFIYSLLLALLILVMAARPVVVYTFQVGAPFSNKNAKFWPVLAIFAYFVINLCFFFGAPLTGPRNCVVVPQNMKNTRYGCLSIVGFTLTASPVLAADLQTKCAHVEKISLCIWMYAKYPAAMPGLSVLT